MFPVAYQTTTGPIDDCRAAATIALREYWHGLPVRSGGLPSYADVQLMDLYKIAHQVSVKDVIDGGRDFVNRYWGSELTRALGFEATGKRVSEYQPDEMRDMLFTRYIGIVSSRAPVLYRARIEHIHHRKHVPYEVLHVPFVREGGDEISNIMTVYEFNTSAPE
ncbi:MAG: PAS domain-containing protein [Rhodospirillales bacterium]|nr:PAS domain-containing protein [Rhodospirillales bacterium]MBO6786702.1 PAS domain-containing protein [Rhodospirillales bacterium]